MNGKKKKFNLWELIDFAGTLIILNMLFVIFSIPIFTIGSAYNALYTASRAVIKDEPAIRTFLKTFFKDFGKPTLFWVALLPLNAALLFSTATIYFYQKDGYIPILILSVIAVIITLGITSMGILFNTFFDCPAKSLFKNAVLVYAANPLRGFLIGLIAWLPLHLYIALPWTFFEFIMIWFFAYFAVGAMLTFSLIKKPFDRLSKQFAEALEEAAQEQEIQETVGL